MISINLCNPSTFITRRNGITVTPHPTPAMWTRAQLNQWVDVTPKGEHLRSNLYICAQSPFLFEQSISRTKKNFPSQEFTYIIQKNNHYLKCSNTAHNDNFVMLSYKIGCAGWPGSLKKAATHIHHFLPFLVNPSMTSGIWQQEAVFSFIHSLFAYLIIKGTLQTS